MIEHNTGADSQNLLSLWRENYIGTGSPEEDAKQALESRGDYIEEVEREYVASAAKLKSAGRVVLAICGNAGAGKDFVAEYICRETGLRYNGSTSTSALPLVLEFAPALSERVVFDTRKVNRDYWYRFCNSLREDDPTLLAKMNLARSDMVVGIRDDYELFACMDHVFDVSIWVDNNRVDADFTVKYSPSDCDIILPNHGSKTECYRKLRRLLSAIT